MSKAYREFTLHEDSPSTTPDMREYCKRPGRVLEDGRPEYTTQQHHKAECDINKIIEKYDKKGVITHISRFEAKFGDLTGLDFKTMQDKVANALSMFEALPWKIKARFGNSPANLLEFMEHPENRPEAIKLGLIDPHWADDEDGLGEHVKRSTPADNYPAGGKQELDGKAASGTSG